MKKMIFLLLIFLAACQARSCQMEKQGASKEKGAFLYEQHCASCHGFSGDGKGEVAQYLWPKPRDFTSGIFKYRTTRGAIPSDLDLLQTMKLGIPGTSMPGWDLLSMEDWLSLLTVVKSFSPRLMNEKTGPSVDIPKEPQSTPESVQAGRTLYEKSSCVACHGLQGKGDGPGALILKDVWGDRIAPRDLTRGPLKWGNTSRDIYRSLMIGVPGTPMPAFEYTFTKEQLWSLVHYIQSTQRKMPEGYDPANPKRNLLQVSKIEGEIPLDNEADAWLEAKGIPVFLKPLWHESKANEWLTVKALRNEKEIAFYVEWEDDQMNIGPKEKDAVAIQFPFEKIKNPIELPYLGMGSLSKPVMIWEWKAGVFSTWQATGIGNLEPQIQNEEALAGKGVYDQGAWHVIFKRPLSHPKVGYLSFALWDGDLPKHQGPEAFSEWMIYELKE